VHICLHCRIFACVGRQQWQSASLLANEAKYGHTRLMCPAIYVWWLQVRVAAAEASAAAAKSATTEAGMRATRADERLAATQAQLEEQLAAAAEAQVGAR
jgi:ATP-dependent 26S proteasome regulatory subunit